MKFLSLEPRPSASEWMKFGAPVISLLLTALTGFILFFVLGKDPLEAFRVFFLNPVKDFYGLSELLLKSTPLIIIAVGLSFGFRSNVWNIGAEGQFLLGTVGATGIALWLDEVNGWYVLPLMSIAGALCGAAWAAVPAFLKTRFHSNEILVSLMMVYIAQLFVVWLVHGPWKDPDGFNFPQTKIFEESATLTPIVEGTRVNIFFAISLVLAVIAYLIMRHTHLGFRLRVSGQAEAAARYAGFSAKGAVWFGFIVGGAMAGLAGMAEVAGPVGQLTDKLSTNYGFSAIIVAFVGRLNALSIILAAMLMSLLYIGGEQSQQYLGLPSSISMIFQGLLLMFLLGCDVLIHYRFKLKLNPIAR